jgi:adenylylsulfate kinase
MNRLYWITGLAGAGKTTVARALTAELRSRGEPVVLLDGDELREALGRTGSHSPADRLELATSYARLGRLFYAQGLNVVCATISPFPQVRQSLRESTPGYVEVYVRVSRATLMARDQKGLYSRAAAGNQPYLVGQDIPFVEPLSPDVCIDNEPGTLVSDHVTAILNLHYSPLRRSA